MDYHFLGKTGLKISQLGLGTMTLGRETDEKESYAILDHFAEVGGIFIDTANSYTDGQTEELVGRWLKQKNRDQFVVATKVRFPVGSGVNDIGLSRKHLLTAIENSLRRLQTDYVDLYQMHFWDHVTPLEETLSTLDGLVKSGKVRYIGASNFKGWQLQKALDLSRQHGWESFVSLQTLYNLLDRTIEWELLEVCQAEGLGVITWSPLRGGWLSGKYSQDMDFPPEGTRIHEAEKQQWTESWTNYNTERTWKIIDAIRAVAKDIGKEPVQVALNWLIQQPAITAPLIGARTLEQFKTNLGALGWQLSPENMARLTKVSDVPLPYPHDFLQLGRGVR